MKLSDLVIYLRGSQVPSAHTGGAKLGERAAFLAPPAPHSDQELWSPSNWLQGKVECWEVEATADV